MVGLSYTLTFIRFIIIILLDCITDFSCVYMFVLAISEPDLIVPSSDKGVLYFCNIFNPYVCAIENMFVQSNKQTNKRYTPSISAVTLKMSRNATQIFRIPIPNTIAFTMIPTIN